MDLESEDNQKTVHRVALITSEHTYSQYPVFLRHLLVGLADESVPVALVCPQSCNVDSLLIGAVEIIRYPVLELPFAGHFNNKFLIEKLMKFKPSILHCLCESRFEVTKLLAWRLNLPYVLTVNALHKRFSLSGNFGTKLPISEVHCKKIMVPSASIADNIMKLYPHLADIVQHVNRGTFTSTKTSCFLQPSDFTTIVIAYPARYSDVIENIFNSIRHLRIDGYEFMIFLVSSDSLFPKDSFFTKRSNFVPMASKTEKKLWKLLNALDLAQQATMVPMQIPASYVLSSGDIFIYPGPNYVFNSLLLEAMSTGTAVIASKGGVDDMIIADETAVILETIDEPGIMRTMQRLLDRPEFARQLARNAQHYVRKNHSVSNMIAQILQIYNEAAG
jgi:glycosyltransferase involved in cell wall biosynthesis